MKKLVTKLINNISLCRDLMTKPRKDVINRIYVFECVTNEVQRQVIKWLNDKSYELDFTGQDLYELSDEITEYLEKQKFDFSYESFNKQLAKYEVIDGAVINSFTQGVADSMYLDGKLRKAQKTLAYYGLLYSLGDKREGENDKTSRD